MILKQSWMDLFTFHVSIVLVYKSIKQCSWRCFFHGHFLYHGDIKEKRSSQIKKKKRKEKKRKERKRKEYIVVGGSFLKPGQIETDAY